MAADQPTQYAKNGDIHIAYKVMGTGPVDLLIVPGLLSHLELQWEQDPQYRAWVRRLASFSRLILLDNRCSGLSDRDVGESEIAERVEDLRAVLDAAGSKRCALLGMTTGCALAITFAQQYPDRTTSLVLCGGFASPLASDPEGIALPLDQLQALVATTWGSGQLVGLLAPAQQAHPQGQARAARLERAALSPRAARAAIEQARQIDVTALARSLKQPALVLHRCDDALVPVEFGRWLGFNIDKARYLERLGSDNLPWSGDNTEEDLDEIQQFLTGTKPDQDTDRFLSTVFFADIVNSTGHLARQGDRTWAGTLARYYELMRENIKRFGGKEIDTAGDGFFVTFSLPTRAVRCAIAARKAVHDLGIDLRVGLHTGECQRQGSAVVGIAVHTAARIMGVAQPGEVVVSRTLTDLIAGSGLGFQDIGIHVLRNVPGEWRLFRAEQDAEPSAHPQLAELQAAAN